MGAAFALQIDHEDRGAPTPILKLPVDMGPKEENRRFIPRVRSTFRALDLESGASYSGMNLSFGGLMCMTPEPTWPGNILELQLELQGRAPIAVRARVVELVALSGELAMRLRFEGLPADVRKSIALWMARGLGV